MNFSTPAADLPIFDASCLVRGDVVKEDDAKKKILTLREVAERLRCSKAHASKLLKGQIRGVPALTHMEMGRRKVVREEWLDQWMNEGRRQC